MSDDLDMLLERAAAGHRASAGRLVSLVERAGPEADALERRLGAGAHGHVVGITGPPGAGKSTLTGRLLGHWIAAGRRPAVLAVDPSSPLTGGAILGDRVRMDEHARGAFVRSMATRGHGGGLAAAVPAALRLLDALGFDPLVVETAGVGQVEVAVTAAADTTVLVAPPGAGDAIQANKAGLLEVADVLVVNKADRPGAADTVRDLELMLDLGRASGHQDRRGGHRAPVLRTVATTGEGIAELAAAVDAHRRALDEAGNADRGRRRRLRLEVQSRAEGLLVDGLRDRLDGPAGRELLDAVSAGRVSVDMAARALAAGSAAV